MLTSLKQDITTLELEPGGGGCFEVFLDGERIYSKLETGEFPEESEILGALRSRNR